MPAPFGIADLTLPGSAFIVEGTENYILLVVVLVDAGEDKAGRPMVRCGGGK
jgi:hypothetical protein